MAQLAYKPLNTPLMKQIRALSHRGWVALDGLDVLPEQGFAQFELFTGRRAPRRLMRTIVLEEYRGEEGQYDPSSIQTRLDNMDGQPT
jgi:shikimate 5-dehydrogenase